MKKLKVAAVALLAAGMSAFGEGSDYTYQNESYDYTMREVPNSLPYVHPTNVYNVAVREATSKADTAKSDAVAVAKGYVDQFAKRIYQIKGATNTVAQVEAIESPTAGDVWYARDTKKMYVYTTEGSWVELPAAIDLSKYSTTEQMNTAIGNAKTAAETTAAGDATTKANAAKDAAIASAKAYTNQKVAEIDLGAKRDKTDELVYSQTESDWDFSELTKIDPTKLYSIRTEMDSDGDDVTYTYWLDRRISGGGGSLIELEKHPDDASVSNENLTRFVIKSVVSETVDAAFKPLIGTIIYKRGVVTGDTLAHESLKADAEASSVYAIVDDAKVVVGEAKGLPIRNLSWYYSKGTVSNIKLYDKDSGEFLAAASAVSDWDGSVPSFVATFRLGDDEVKLKITSTSVCGQDADNSWEEPVNLVIESRIAKDSKRLGGKTAEEWATLVGNSSNNVLTAANVYTDQKVANIDMSSKRDLRDEYHYALEWDFTEFNAIKDNVGYKVAKDEDNEYIWHVYKVIPGEEDVLIANCSKVDPEEEEPTKLKIIVADLTDGDYAGLADKIISAYPSKTTDKFALKSDIDKLNTSVGDVSDTKADAALYGSKSEVITVNGHDVVVSIENGYAAKYIPLGFNGIGLDAKFYVAVDGSKIEIPLDSCNGEACDDEDDIYNTFTMISFGGDEFPEELTNLGITSVKIEYVSGSSDYASSRFKYTINGTKESSTSIDVKNPSQAADSRKFDGKSAMDWVNTFLPLYFYNKTDANAEFHNKYYVDSNVVTGQIDGVFSEATPNDRNVRIVLRGATLPITDILSWTNKTDCIELYVSNNFSVAYSNPEVYQISTSGTPGFNIRFSEFPNVGIHLEGNVAYIGNAIAPEYKFIGGVGKPYTPWHNPGLAPDSYRFAGRTYEEAAADAAERLEARLGHFVNATNELTIGSGATNANHKESVTLNGCLRYPSYTWGFANVNIGLDNVTGFGDDGVGGVKNSKGVIENGRAYYDVVIGTSSSAKYQHSYVFGSQSHALAENSFIFGYGATTTDNDSTIVGFGTRPQPDKKFNTHGEMLTYLRSFANYAAATNALFVDMMLEVTNSVEHIGPRASPVNLNGNYYIKSIRTSKGGNTAGWAELYQTTPHLDRDEYIRGRHNWTYGKTNGKGTVNLIAKGDGVNNYGLAYVFINGRSLAQWTGIHIGEPVYKTPYNNDLGGIPALCDHDYTIEIGDNSRCTETATSCQAIAIGRDALSDGSATIAVGPNAFAQGAQAVSLGWRANAVGAHAISIGTALKSGNDYWSNGVVNVNSDLALALGTEAINLGYNGKAVADRAITVGAMTRADAPQAIQIGCGTNHVADSFQVRDYLFVKNGELRVGNVTVVKNGEVIGASPEPTIDDVDMSSASYDDGEYTITLKSGSNVTVLPDKDLCEDVEQINLVPRTEGRRNFTVTLPNEPTVRAGLPITIQQEFPENVKVVFKGIKDGNITRLPTQLICTQPYDKLVIFNVEELDDGTDWTPVVTRNNIGFSSGKFSSYGSTALRGYNLHGATAFKIIYPITATTTKTNDVLNLADNQRLSVTHLYRSANMNVDLSALDIYATSSGDTWFEVEYTTPNGTVKLPRKTFNALTGITSASEGLRCIGSLEWVTEGGSNMANGYFVVTTNATNKTLVNPSEVALKYVLNDNTTNTVLMSAMTAVTDPDDPAGFKTPAITGLKLDTTNCVEYITINSDVTNKMYKVVSQL